MELGDSPPAKSNKLHTNNSLISSQCNSLTVTSSIRRSDDIISSAGKSPSETKSPSKSSKSISPLYIEPPLVMPRPTSLPFCNKTEKALGSGRTSPNDYIEVDPAISPVFFKVYEHDFSHDVNPRSDNHGSKTTESNPGVLGLVKNYVTGLESLDINKMPYSIIGFGNGENRVAGDRKNFPALTDAQVFADTYHQEAVIPVAAGSETHVAR